MRKMGLSSKYLGKLLKMQEYFEWSEGSLFPWWESSWTLLHLWNASLVLLFPHSKKRIINHISVWKGQRNWLKGLGRSMISMIATHSRWGFSCWLLLINFTWVHFTFSALFCILQNSIEWWFPCHPCEDDCNVLDVEIQSHWCASESFLWERMFQFGYEAESDLASVYHLDFPLCLQMLLLPCWFASHYQL